MQYSNQPPLFWGSNRLIHDWPTSCMREKKLPTKTASEHCLETGEIIFVETPTEYCPNGAIVVMAGEQSVHLASAVHRGNVDVVTNGPA
ncbi:hypothetical protein J6590_017324 [Homalodisca vitripennis]|nr:hypothetical protein J6590_017324 [Homalodisca vitripennis]